LEQKNNGFGEGILVRVLSENGGKKGGKKRERENPEPIGVSVVANNSNESILVISCSRITREW